GLQVLDTFRSNKCIIMTGFSLKDYPIVIGIDFGTTFSPNQLRAYAKTPTTSLYEVDEKDQQQGPLGKNDEIKENEENTGTRFVTWGWQAKQRGESRVRNQKLLQEFKLQLDESFTRNSTDLRVGSIQAIADYLEAFNAYITQEILSGFGDGFTAKMFRYCLTVPAMWSDKAKYAMRLAAIQAKLITREDHPARLTLVTEPEAAALYCELKCKQLSLKDKDRFMVCDAGGGTVDLIVYEINETTEGRRLSEVTKGHGDTCGSVFVDRNLKDLVVEKFHRQGVELPEKVLSKMMDQFIYDIKPHFNGEKNHFLDLPSNPCFNNITGEDEIGIVDGELRLDCEELKKKVFDPVVSKVLELIEQQLSSAGSCSTILLVGGFGSSDYLSALTREKFYSKVKQILVPHRPDLAVVRGAVYAGLNPKVTARISRRWYGISTMQEFREGIDPESHRYNHSMGSRCNNRFSLMAKKGQRLEVDECVEVKGHFINERHLNFATISIHAFDGNDKPPDYTTSSGVFELAKFRFENPFSSTDEVKKEVIIKLYFGLSEIKATAKIDDKELTTNLHFDATDSY
ncbi:hypothetical protein BGW38_009959, partial [Lunasporangiospora selenospora]